MPEYKVNPVAFSAQRKKMFIWSVAPAIAGVSAYFIYRIFISPDQDPFGYWLNIILFPLLIGVFLFYSRKRIIKTLPQLESFTLIITDKMIIREQEGMDMLGILFTDIRKVRKFSSGVIVIYGKQSTDNIYIPTYLDNRPALEEELSALSPIGDGGRLLVNQAGWLLLALLIGGAFVGLLLATNKWLVLGCMIFFDIFMMYALNYSYKSKNIPERSRKLMWVILIPVLAATINGITRFLEL